MTEKPFSHKFDVIIEVILLQLLPTIKEKGKVIPQTAQNESAQFLLKLRATFLTYIFKIHVKIVLKAVTVFGLRSCTSLHVRPLRALMLGCTLRFLSRGLLSVSEA